MAHLYVVSDAVGLVGVFASFSEADALSRKYSTVPLVTQRFPAAPGNAESAWYVLYRAGNVAYVSNSRAWAEGARAALDRVGHVCDEPVDDFQLAVGRLLPRAEERLELTQAAHNAYASLDSEGLDAHFRALEKEDLERLGRIEALSRELLSAGVSEALAAHPGLGEHVNLVEGIVTLPRRADGGLGSGGDGGPGGDEARRG